MVKLRPLRNLGQGVQKRGKGTRSAKPRPSKQHPGATYLFSINISGYPIYVYSADGLGADQTVGEYIPDTHEIYVLKEIAEPAIQADVILHEIMHAISFINMVEEDRMTERQVNALSTALADTLRRNPVLKNWLVARL